MKKMLNRFETSDIGESEWKDGKKKKEVLKGGD
jgi:hypothetical protein